MFCKFDHDNDGTVSGKEILDVFRTVGAIFTRQVSEYQPGEPRPPPSHASVGTWLYVVARLCGSKAFEGWVGRGMIV